MLVLDDTIVAIASPPGGAARAVVRLSGPRARECVESCFRAAEGGHLPVAAAPTAFHGALLLPGLWAPWPAEVFWWPGRRSYTRQPLAEIHTLGSPPLVQAIVRALCNAGARPAVPGEFTLRAFLSGRIDLTQAEAVLGVIDAASEGELEVALAQLAGGLATPLHGLRGALLDLLTELEAGLDFADEDIAFITGNELKQRLADGEASLAAILRQMESRGATGAPLRAVLVGRPNTGKSSLFNALAGQARAIVSDHPGTTRDYLLATLNFDGIPCDLIDTAGVQKPPGAGSVFGALDVTIPSPLSPKTVPVPFGADQAAQVSSAQQRRTAHLELLCIDSSRPLDPWEREELAQPADRRFVVLTKCDAPRQTDCAYPALETSSRTGAGIAALQTALGRAVLAADSQAGGVVAATAARCYASLRAAAECLQRAGAIAASGGAPGDELVAAELREALTELGKVAGDIHSDDVLERIFSRFCIGK